MARRIDNQFLENFKRNTGLMTVFTEKKDKLDTFIKISNYTLILLNLQF